MIAKVKERYCNWRNFILDDMWVLDLENMPAWRRSLLNSLKVVYIVVRGFIKDRCALQAAALTFTTLMTVVPVLALVLSVAKGLRFDENLRWTISNYTRTNFPEPVQQFISKILEIMDQANFVAIGSIGSIFIVATLVRVMNRVEWTMNEVWGVKDGRPIYRKFADYLSVMIVVPVLFILATSINAALASETITSWLQSSLAYMLPDDPNAIGLQTNYHLWFLYFTGYALVMRCIGILGIIGALTFLYKFMPHTKVQLRSAVIGGLCAGILWLLWQYFCINFQFWITKYNALYGAFASLPVALFWLNVNWMIILFGAQISFAYQNYGTYVLEQEAHTVSYALRRRLAFRIVYEICKAFRAHSGPWHPNDFQVQQHVPVRLLYEVLHLLQSNDVIMQSSDGGWVPAREIEEISMKDVEMAIAGRLTGKFRHLGDLPTELVPVFEAQHQSYLEQLGSRTYDEMVHLAPDFMPETDPPDDNHADENNVKTEDKNESAATV